MSGIAGIFSRKGESIDSRKLHDMVNILAHRGPDGSGAWINPPVGLVHRLLYTTSESLFEKQPLAESQLCITADARIDNREELLGRLNLPGRPDAEITDCRLILAAYRRWGKDCPQKLLGDFAFAIWDGQKQELFCARDPFGVKPFYYFLSGEWFFFSSEIKAILCCPQVPARLNESWMGNFLVPSGNFLDKEATFYRDIVRLPPAHALSVSAAGHSLACYWKLDPEREIQLKSDGEYAEALREQFSRAVRYRLRGAFPVGSTLSGGLDSSSIACMARNLSADSGQGTLHTFSAIFQDAPDADESPYIQAVVDQGGFVPHYLHPDRGSPFIDLERVLWHLDEPFYGPNYFMPWSIYECAGAAGVRVILDGTDGDTTISHGMDYLEVLAGKCQWREFAGEAKAVTQKYDHPRFADLLNILYSYGAPQLARLVRQGQCLLFLQGVQEMGRLFNVSRKGLAIQWGLMPNIPRAALESWNRLCRRAKPAFQVPNAIAPGFVQKLTNQMQRDVEANAPDFRQNNGRKLHHHFLGSGMLPYTLEMINRLASAFQVEVRFPFCDRNLVSFCLALPPEQKLRQGWGRYVMRNAMTGVLPEKVQWRGGKTSLAKVYPYMLRNSNVDFVEDILNHPPDILADYINYAVILEMYHKFQKEDLETDLEWVWQTVVLSAWAKQRNLTV